MEIFILKGILYALILAYASFYDIKTKTIPDKVHIVIVIVALINLNSLNSIIGLLLVPIPFFITALIKGGGIGGGDVKFMGANGFFLGVKGGFIASIIGLTLAVVANFIYYKIKKKDKNISFPLAPYLSIGCFLTYLLF
ncbi:MULTISPECIES: prepilin peptidase [Clostridium]|uniref:Prepilin peptidase n=1 Tax=Clostridium manihotivorum TaxID=2320868 RepID=A0A3R5QY23_9CLOT|nr:prepilin peptidase [Clostridium manihotivorum]QAA34930.1 prepilin peptidase [Clostridium manihotivorum]